MNNKYFLMCVGTKQVKSDNPYLIGLSPKDLSTKRQSIAWMEIGSGANDDYRYCERITENTFKCVDTNEIFTVNGRGCFTVKAWDNFINSFKS